jgi:hypothetical protein
MVGVRGGNRRDVRRPRISGVQLGVQTRRSCFPICHRYRSRGGSWAGRQWGNFPRSPGASPPVPRTVCHLLVVVVTLGENGWRASTLATEQAAPRAAASGVRRVATPGICRDVYPNNATVHRNCSLTRSLLHLASRAHSSCDDKEVIPCHPGHNRCDHRPHRR